MTQYPPVTAEQLEALAHLAKQNGRNWNAKLSNLWMRAAAEPVLHGLRNSHGPSWLSQFSLSLKL